MSFRTRLFAVLIVTAVLLVTAPRATEAVHLITRVATLAEADLIVTKTGPASAAAGTDVSFNVVVFNSSSDDATNLTLTDGVPAGLTFVSATQNNTPTFSCLTPAAGASSGNITCTIASLPGGATGDFT